MESKYACKEPTCKYDLMNGIGIKTETSRVFTKGGFDNSKEYSEIKKYFCPICGTTVRRKLGEEIHKQLTMKGQDMKAQEIIDLITGLSRSQGHWGRMLEVLNDLNAEDGDYFNQLMATWESCDFDALGFILFIEEEPVNEWSVEDILRWKKEKENVSSVE